MAGGGFYFPGAVFWVLVPRIASHRKFYSWRDCPGGTVDKNPPANTGDKGSIPGPGRFHRPWSSQARAAQLLNLSAATLKPARPEAMLRNGKPMRPD